MNTRVTPQTTRSPQHVAQKSSTEHSNPSTLFADTRPEAAAHSRLLEMMASSPRMAQFERQIAPIAQGHANDAQLTTQLFGATPAEMHNDAARQDIGLHSSAPVQLATKITHKAGTVPLGGHQLIVGKAMSANLDPKDPVTGSATTAVNYEWMRYMRAVYPNSNVIRGHLLNHDLGGYGVPENLYPISSIANALHSEKVEQNVKAKLTESYKNNLADITYNVAVNEKGPAERPYQEAEFVCSWTDGHGTAYNEVIPSHLQVDSGWIGGNHKQQSPKPWRHGSRRGEENFAFHTQPLGRISVDKTAALASLGGLAANYDAARLKTVSGAGNDREQAQDARAIIREEIDALATLPALGATTLKIVADANIFYAKFDSLYTAAVAANNFSAFTPLIWQQTNEALNKITEERLYIEHGID